MKKALISFVLLANCTLHAMEKEEDNKKGKEKTEYYGDYTIDVKKTQNSLISSAISLPAQVIHSPTNHVSQSEKLKKQTPINSPNNRWNGPGKSKLSQEISYDDLLDASDKDERSMGISIEDESLDQGSLAAGMQLTGKKPHFIDPQILIDEAIIAIISEDNVSMKKLLDQGLDPNGITAEGVPLIQVAHNNGQLEMVTMFEKKAAANSAQKHCNKQSSMPSKPTAKVNYVISAMLEDVTKCIKDKNESMLKSLLRHINVKNLDKNAKEPLLLTAVRGLSTKIVELLLHNDLDVNDTDIDGWTPLMEAVTQENIEIIELLVQNGADANARDITGSTAISLAQNCSNPYIQRYFDPSYGTFEL